MIEISALPDVPEVRPGDDLAALVVAACRAGAWTLADGDVLCVAQKVVSKAEGALVTLAAGEDPIDARRRIAREQAARIVAEAADVLITETEHGFVCANAGVDASNVPPGMLSLLPTDPDASARRLAAALRQRGGVEVGVVISDTFGRPWRLGQTDVAIGVAGIAPLRDERGGLDRHGRRLEVTLVAVADELAAAADLARRKAGGVPFVVIRGAAVERDRDGSARQLLRPADEDLFRRGAR
ncbi:MAG: coenzyme F420-0:L-glutamate ligase [Actinobacteria bacterium]|nr:coenzyme F420-0:L-glutamate ligase [Actinomycetota bacterium]